jgi:predicted TIM-barrel fold metal-dependent hydrolase
LRELYLPEAEVLTRERKGWARGGDMVASYLASVFVRPIALAPVDYRLHGDTADIQGYYSRASDLTPVGYFQITAERQPDRSWRIAREVPVFPFPQVQAAITADDMVRMLDEAGIQRAVLLSEAFWFDGPLLKVDDPYPKVMAENDWTAAQAARYPARLIAFCSFNPVADHALAELERCAASGRFRGLKMSFAMSGVDLRKPEHLERVKAVFAAANRRRLPVVVHLSNGPGYGAEHVRIFLDQVLPVAPDIVVQVAHLWGGEAYSQPALDLFVDAFERRLPQTRNLYFDLAETWTARTPENLSAAAQAARRIGLGRMLYGSDAALNGRLRPKQAWRTLQQELPLTPQEWAQIARQTAPYLR